MFLAGGDSALCEWSSRFLDSPRKICPRIRAGVKAARRKVASTEQFIKNRTLEVGERAGPGIATDLRLGVSFPFVYEPGYGAPRRGFQSKGFLLPVGKGSFGLYWVLPEVSWPSSPSVG